MKQFIWGTTLWFILGYFYSINCGEVEEIFHWKEVIYENLPYKENSYIGKYPYYLPEQNDVFSISYHAQSGLMVTVVGRLRPGVPSTLNAFCVADYDKGTSPYLWGFPDYEKNTLQASFYEHISETSRDLLETKKNYSSGYYKYFFGQNSNLDSVRKNSYNNFYYPLPDYNLISVYHSIVHDQCNRLYAIDTGSLYYSPTLTYFVQNPALLVFNLPPNGCETREFSLIRRVEIPKNLWTNPVGLGGFITIDSDPKGSCDKVFLYTTNVLDNNLIVYDYEHNKFWSFEDPSMLPIQAESNFIFNQFYHYTFNFGIFGVVLGWPDKHGNKNVYFNALASTVEYSVSSKILRNSKRSALYYTDNSEDITLIGFRGCGSETFSKVIDPSTGVIFYGEVQSNKVRCWNTQLPLNPDTVGVAFESDDLLITSDIIIDSEGYLWFLSNHLPIIFTSEIPLNLTEINSRVFRVKASDAIKGTVCDL